MITNLHHKLLFSSSKSDNREDKREKKSYSKDKKEKPLCVFCRREHPSKSCDVVTKPEVRKSIVTKEKRCFVCLSASHQAGDCKKKWKCFKCGGRHNYAICTFKKPDEDQKSESASSNVNLSRVNTIILRTAKAEISSRDGKKSAQVRILLESGSQQSYISHKTKKLLNLKTQEKRTVSIKSFGNAKRENILDVVEFTINAKQGEKINVEALVSDLRLKIKPLKLLWNGTHIYKICH